MSRFGLGIASLAVVGAAAGCGGSLASDPPNTTIPPTIPATTATSPVDPTPAVGSTQANAPTTSGGPVPSGFSPSSFTAISDEDWWLLGSAPCITKPCTSIVHTTNAGKTFAGTSAPKTALSQKGITQLRFGNAEDGFAFGDQLWETHDGGRVWSKQHIGLVSELAISDGTAYAVVGIDTGTVLMKSSVGGGNWTEVHTPAQVSGGLWVQGSHIFVQSGLHGTGVGNYLLTSGDSGATWAKYQIPTPGLPCIFDQLQAPVLWEKCASGMSSSVEISDNDGKTSFKPSPEGQGEFINGALLAASSNSTAIVTDEQGPIFLTRNGGRSFAAVALKHMASWDYLGFTDADHGVAIGQPRAHGRSRLYVTDDAGADWHKVTIAN